MTTVEPCPHEHEQRVLGMSVVPLDIGNQPRWHVRCLDCGATGPRASTEGEAIAAWNKRASAPAGVTEGAHTPDEIRNEIYRREEAGVDARVPLTAPAWAAMLSDADLRRMLQPAAPLPNPEADQLREAAERWRALMSSVKMHWMGSAGFEHRPILATDSRLLEDQIPIPRDGELWHFGMEFWFGGGLKADPEFPDTFERRLMVAYVDAVRAALTKETTNVQ